MRVCSILKVYETGKSEHVYLLETEKFGRKECLFSDAIVVNPKTDNITVYDSIYQALAVLDGLVDTGILKKFQLLKVSHITDV